MKTNETAKVSGITFREYANQIEPNRSIPLAKA